MKSIYPLLAILLVTSVLASGCIQQPSGTPGGTTGGTGGQAGTNPPPSSPPPSGLQPGAWAKVSMILPSAKPVEFTYRYVEKMINGVAFIGTEMETSSGVSLFLTENTNRTEPVKMYSLNKLGQLVLCNAVTTKPENTPTNTDPYAYDAANGTHGVTSLGTDSYTTPTGKTVTVVKYKVEMSGTEGEYWYKKGEYWYSIQVPFVLVKSEVNTTIAGKNATTKMELQDFGTGAMSAFTQKDLEKCY